MTVTKVFPTDRQTNTFYWHSNHQNNLNKIFSPRIKVFSLPCMSVGVHAQYCSTQTDRHQAFFTVFLLLKVILSGTLHPAFRSVFLVPVTKAFPTDRQTNKQNAFYWLSNHSNQIFLPTSKFTHSLLRQFVCTHNCVPHWQTDIRPFQCVLIIKIYFLSFTPCL